jgi:DDE superfamily endonuclease/Helix-turn-helix of DDE superfamily endonuclease
MLLRADRLRRHPAAFSAMTGLTPGEFDALVDDLWGPYRAAERARRARPGRTHAVGAGPPFALAPQEQMLLTVIWLRLYPTMEVLGFLFGVSDTTAQRAVGRRLPLLEAAGHDSLRRPDPGRKGRRDLGAVLGQVPELAVVIDSLEQRVQRPRDRAEADRHYSGKKKMHTLKSQVAVTQHDGRLVDVGPSVRGPTADSTLLAQSGLLARLDPNTLLYGDKAYQKLRSQWDAALVVVPRRKPRNKPRPPQDVAYNRQVARARIVVEHTIRRIRCYQAVTQTDRHHRHGHDARMYAVGGLVNRQIDHRCAA